MSTLSYRPMDYKVAVACWPITRAIGRELEKQLKLLFVFNKGKSAIFSTVNGDVYSLGLNPSGVLGTGQNQICNAPTKITGIKEGEHIGNALELVFNIHHFIPRFALK